MNRRNALRHAGLIAGAATLTPTLLTLLQSCEAQPRIDWQPQFLTEDEALFLAAFVDTILPRTDTPGGLDLKADLFMDKVFAETYDAEGQRQVRENITAFNTQISDQFGAPFQDLNAEDRSAALQAAEAASGKFNGQVWGTAVGKQEPVGFYRSLKSMAIGAYLSSEQVGKEILRYDPIPGGYDGCLSLEEGDRAWSL